MQLYQVRLYAWVSEGMEDLFICYTIIIFTPPCYYMVVWEVEGRGWVT